MLYRFICFIMFAGFLAGCSQPADTEGSADQTATQSSAPVEPDAYYEFLWCEFGDNYTEEARDAYFASFNEIADSMTERGLRSFGYRPRDWESEDFDALWVNRWPDKEASEQGWAEWQAKGGNATLQGKHPGVLNCGQESGVNVFGYTTYIPKDIPASFNVESPPYHVDNLFCSFNEGQGPEQLRSFVRDQYMPFLDRYAADNPDNSYWFAIGVPDVVLENYPQDFNWINYFKNSDEASVAIANYDNNEVEIQNAMAEVVTCTDRQLWNGVPIRVLPDPI